MVATLRDIELFVAAYEERSFTAAAAREKATQSGVSQHVRSLESAFKARLFVRDRGRIVPTPAADTFYRHCVEILRAHRAGCAALAGHASGFEGELVVGTMPALAKSALAPALARFMERHPNVVIRVVEGFSAALTEKCQAAEIDFAIVPALSGLAGIRSRLLLRTPELLVSASGGRLVHGEPVRLADLGPIRLTLPARTNIRRDTIETYCTSNGVSVARILELDSVLGALDIVARTDWVTILPAITIADDREAPGLVVNPIVAPDLDLDLVVIEPARQPLSPVADVFLELLEDEIRSLSEGWRRRREAASG